MDLRTFRQWIALVALSGGLTSPAASQSVVPLSERVARFPDSAFQAWFGTMLASEYREGPDWEAFFGDVGPTKGCAAHKEIRARIVQRDLPLFRAAYVAAVAERMKPEVFAEVPDSFLTIQFNSRISPFQRDLRDFLRPRVAELGGALRNWSTSHGYLGRRLGYNGNGIPYWGKQPAMTSMVCSFPNDAGLLKGWK